MTRTPPESALRWHPPTFVPSGEPPPLRGPTHRSRLALETLLADPADESAWLALVGIYAEQAREWADWAGGQRWYAAPVAAGLAHAHPADWVLEVCCGSGQATALLAQLCGEVLATDVNRGMLDAAPSLPRTRYEVADVRHLPCEDGTVPMLIGLNAVPFVPEFTRVIRPGGQVLWCSSFGRLTPLRVAPDRLATIFGPGWRAEGGIAGFGDWLLLTRLPA